MDGRINWDYSYLSLKVEVEVEAELGKSLNHNIFLDTKCLILIPCTLYLSLMMHALNNEGLIIQK